MKRTSYEGVLTKAAAPMDIKASTKEEGLFEGYLSRWMHADSYWEASEKGAFNTSLRTRGPNSPTPRIHLRWEHSQTVGVWKRMEEDSTGLYVVGKVVDDGANGTAARALLREAAPLGLSIGFRRVRSRPGEEYDAIDFSYPPFDGNPVAKSEITILQEVRLMEGSLVSFPAVDQALVTAGSYRSDRRVHPVPAIPVLNRKTPHQRALEAEIAIAEAELMIERSKPVKTTNIITIPSPDAPATKSAGQRLIESKGYAETQELRFSTSRRIKFAVDVPDLLSQKALIHSGALPAGFVAPDVRGTFAANPQLSNVRRVLLGGTTTSNLVVIAQENTAASTNAAAETPEATHTSAASESPVNASVKPESTFALTRAEFLVQTVSHWVPVTTQAYDDSGLLQLYVDGALRDGLEDRIASQVLNGDGTNPDLLGLLNAGIQNLDSTYFSGAPVNNAGDDNENANRLRRAKRLIQTTGRANPSFILLNPTDAEELETASSATEGIYLYPGSSGLLGGLPVYPDNAVPAGTGIVGDGSKAAILDRQEAQILVGYVDDQRIRNMVTILAEARTVLVVFRPAAFAKVALAS